MRDRLQESLSAHRNKLVSLLSRYVAKGKEILQSHDLIGELDNVVNEDESMKILKDSPFSKGLQSAQEAIVLPPFVAIAIHPRPGLWEYVHINVFELSVDLLSVAEYLQFKEELVDGQCNDNYFLELDFEPFSATFNQLNHQPLGMGFNSSTVTYLQAMMLNDWIQNISKLQSALARVEEYLSKLPLTKYTIF